MDSYHDMACVVCKRPQAEPCHIKSRGSGGDDTYDNINPGTVERVVMNLESGAIGLGIRIDFHDKYFYNSLEKMPDYEVAFRPSKPDGWLIFSGENDARGPWIFIDASMIDGKIEDLGEL